MKWTLDLEMKDIELDIQNNMFVLKTDDQQMQFDFSRDMAYKMLMQLRAVMKRPWVPEKEMVERIEGKPLETEFVQNNDNRWVMDLRYGDREFQAALIRKDLERFSQVLGKYIIESKK